MGILGPGSVCSPRALLMRRIIINGYLLDSRIPFHIEVVKLGIGKDSKIIFKSEALVIRLHVLWGMYRVQVCNVLGYIGCPTTAIKARHIPDYGIRSGREYQPTVLGEFESKTWMAVRRKWQMAEAKENKQLEVVLRFVCKNEGLNEWQKKDFSWWDERVTLVRGIGWGGM